MALTAKQQRFCEEYLIDLNGTQAAIRAGYSQKTANEQAARLLANVSAKELILKLKQERSKRTEITADRVLQRLAQIAFTDIDSIVRVEEVIDTEIQTDEEGAEIQVPVKRLRVAITPTAELPREVIPLIAGIKQGRDGIEIKTQDQKGCLELIGRHLSMWNDKVDLTSKGESIVEKRPVTLLPDGTKLEI